MPAVHPSMNALTGWIQVLRAGLARRDQEDGAGGGYSDDFVRLTFMQAEEATSVGSYRQDRADGRAWSCRCRSTC